MFSFKKRYFIIIETIKDVDLNHIKIFDKFTIIYRCNKSRDKVSEITEFRKKCKLKFVKFYVANDCQLAILLKSDGIYISAFNKSFTHLNLIRRNFEVIGSAHNQKEIDLKKKQKCKYIILSRLFFVKYKENLNHLGLIKFNISTLCNQNLIPLGGIKTSNLNKTKSVMSEYISIMSEVKKKPAILSRLF